MGAEWQDPYPHVLTADLRTWNLPGDDVPVARYEDDEYVAILFLSRSMPVEQTIDVVRRGSPDDVFSCSSDWTLVPGDEVQVSGLSVVLDAMSETPVEFQSGLVGPSPGPYPPPWLHRLASVHRAWHAFVVRTDG